MGWSHVGHCPRATNAPLSQPVWSPRGFKCAAPTLVSAQDLHSWARSPFMPAWAPNPLLPSPGLDLLIEKSGERTPGPSLGEIKGEKIESDSRQSLGGGPCCLVSHLFPTSLLCGWELNQAGP